MVQKALGAAAIAGLAIWGLWPVDPTGGPAEETDEVGLSGQLMSSTADEAMIDPSAADEDAETPDESQTEEEKAAAEDAAVAAFDAMIEKWQEPRKGGISMDDIASFAQAFRQVPEDRRDEEIHHAINLVPDENVMLLVGVLLDKSFGKEIVETIFNDILNRDEDVKRLILQGIYKDKTHPCWADAAWILDVTGERLTEPR